MEKQEMPRLETQGFVSRRYARPTWKDKAIGIVDRIKRRSKAADEDTDIAYKRLLYKTGVCAAAAVAILVISSVSTPASAEINKAVDYVVNHEFEIDEDIGRLKFVEALDETESVFSAMPEGSVAYPADGEVVSAFGEGGSNGIRMSALTPEIMNIAKGTVTAVNELDGEAYIEVALDSGETVTYHNLTPCVKVDDIVMPGQVIGKVQEGYLYIEMKKGGRYIDPVGYINSHAGLA